MPQERQDAERDCRPTLHHPVVHRFVDRFAFGKGAEQGGSQVICKIVDLEKFFKVKRIHGQHRIDTFAIENCAALSFFNKYQAQFDTFPKPEDEMLRMMRVGKKKVPEACFPDFSENERG